MSEFHPFIRRLSNIPLYVYAKICLSFHLSMDTWVVSTFWLLWIMLLWIPLYIYLFESLLSILWGKYLEVKLTCHMVTLCLVFWGTTILFPTVSVPLYVPSINAQVSQFFHILANNCHFQFFKTIITILMSHSPLWFSSYLLSFLFQQKRTKEV